MATYIEYTTPHAEFKTWYVGQSIEGIRKEENIRRTVSIQADGHELEYILSNFSMIPFVKDKRVQTWYGDTAKFIVKHLY